MSYSIITQPYYWQCSCGVQKAYPTALGADEGYRAVENEAQGHRDFHGRQLDKDRNFLDHAYMAAEMATCSRLKVGAVIVDRHGYIVSTGRNGAPIGLSHCEHLNDQPCQISMHAELNACLFSGRQKALGGTMYVTHSPCLSCSGALINVGLKAVVYDQLYKNTDGIERLTAAGIEVRELR